MQAYDEVQKEQEGSQSRSDIQWPSPDGAFSSSIVHSPDKDDSLHNRSGHPETASPETIRAGHAAGHIQEQHEAERPHEATPDKLQAQGLEVEEQPNPVKEEAKEDPETEKIEGKEQVNATAPEEKAEEKEEPIHVEAAEKTEEAEHPAELKADEEVRQESPVHTKQSVE